MSKAIQDELLNDSEVRAVTEIRQRSADKARAAKKAYERSGVAFIVAGAVATIAGALILLGTGADGAKDAAEAASRAREALTPATLASVQWYLSQPVLRSVLFIIEILALAVAAYNAEFLRSSKSEFTWVSERREAEAGRITKHDTIMACAQARDAKNPGTWTYEQVAFAHFVTDQLNEQLNHYANKEKAASEGAWKTVRIGAILAAVVAGVGATGTIGQWWMVIGAFVGVIAPVLMHGLTKYRDMKLDREQSEASAASWKVLREIAGDVDAATAALAAGNPEPAREIVAKTHACMKAENEAWMPTKSPI